MLSHSCVRVLNHLLTPEPNLRAALIAHAGKTVQVSMAMIALRLSVTHEGYLQVADAEIAPHLTLSIPAASLPLLIQGPQALMQTVTLNGDAEFAQTLSRLARELRWDAEEDLSKFAGDAAAHRIIKMLRAVLEQGRTASRNLTENIVEYLADERRDLVRPIEFQTFSQQVIELRDAVERLGKRVEKRAAHAKK